MCIRDSSLGELLKNFSKSPYVVSTYAFLILFIFQLFQSDFKIDKEVDFFFKHSPGILFCLLPAIASRPCFERGLKVPGFLGLLLSLGLVALAVTQNN